MANDARVRRTACLRHLIEQNSNQRIVGSGERHAEIVEHALPRELAHRGWQVIVCESARFFGDKQGQIGLVCPVLYHVIHPSLPIQPRSIFQSFV